MKQFLKGNDQDSYFQLNFQTFLANEGAGVAIASIDSVTLVSGDVVLGTGSRAPSLRYSGQVIQFYVSGGTTNTRSVFEFIYTLTNGDTFDARVEFTVLDSLQ